VSDTGRAAPFHIRPAAVGEATPLAALGARLFTQAYGPTHPEPTLGVYLARAFAPERLAAELARDDVRLFVAEDGVGEAIGYAYLRESPAAPAGVQGARPFEVVRFYVEAAWHGRGVAHALMHACVREATERGGDVLWLAVWKQAARPLAFYRRLGFTVVGTTIFEFGDRVDDDHVMARPLGSAADGERGGAG
jgi:ribosomal protein S18 acetylase RimI-like enzyme